MRIKVGFRLSFVSHLSFYPHLLFADILESSKLISEECKEKVGMRYGFESSFI